MTLYCAIGPIAESSGRRAENRGVGEVGLGDDAGALAVIDQQRLNVEFVHFSRGAFQRAIGGHGFEPLPGEIADARPHHRTGAHFVLRAIGGFELASDVEIEERGEACIVADEFQREFARQQMAERFFARDKSVGAGAEHERPAVETVAGTAKGHEIGAVPLLDLPLDDDEQTFGRAITRNDRLAGSEIADVQRATRDLDLAGRQPVERRVGNVEAVGHLKRPPRAHATNAVRRRLAIGDRSRAVGRAAAAC